MTDRCQEITINTISGGIVNFGGAIKIAPISITKSTSGTQPSQSASGTSGTNAPSNLTNAGELEAVGNQAPF